MWRFGAGGSALILVSRLCASERKQVVYRDNIPDLVDPLYRLLAVGAPGIDRLSVCVAAPPAISTSRDCGELGVRTVAGDLDTAGTSLERAT